MIRIRDYPQLQSLTWNRPKAEWLEEQEALSLYEANWRWIEPDKLTSTEAALIARLIRDHGKGVLNV